MTSREGPGASCLAEAGAALLPELWAAGAWPSAGELPRGIIAVKAVSRWCTHALPCKDIECLWAGDQRGQGRCTSLL